MNAIRTLDITFSLIGMVVLLPVFLVIAILVKFGSSGPVIYKQSRVGRNGEPFWLYKFRTMRTGADQKGLLTIGGKDMRITRFGYLLRQYKLDELPQLWNVLVGNMSLVGPRPEVKKYVDLYDPEQRKVLAVRPGITDLASIVYRNENELLAQAADPEQYYVSVIMPEKINLNKQYINNQSIKEYLSIIFKTIITAIKGK
jgi:lipopolysaccharide/colanic/teichoic acid biosynthesis glycosyltransferase